MTRILITSIFLACITAAGLSLASGAAQAIHGRAATIDATIAAAIG
ncbi:MAG: hypothetical protein L0H83_10065 [Salinisphaera sp.]|nr:hypothetical protein [Salinisphaera sp.]